MSIRPWLYTLTPASVFPVTIDFQAPIGKPQLGTAGLAPPSNFASNEIERINGYL
jgi:hypothetical protein